MAKYKPIGNPPMRFKIFVILILSHATMIAGLRAYAQPNTAPNISYPSPKIYTINLPITPLQPSNSGGPVAMGGYSIDQALPVGLSLDANTGVISGTPTVLSPATIYTITAVNPTGQSKATVNIKVGDEDVGVPKSPSMAYPPQVYQVNVPIAPLSPVSNGGAVKRYSIGLLRDYAGTGSAGRMNGALNAAQFDMPFRTVIAPDGTMYVADFNNYAVRKISNGQVSSFAGEAGPGYANGGFGQAQLQGPTGVAVDSKGNVFVADVFSIRKITPAGVVSTFAGNSIGGYIDATGGAARFNSASSIAIDAQDNVYVADQNNFCIRKISPAGVVTTLAGNGFRGNQDGQGTSAAFNSPQDIILYNGYILVADQLAIRKVTFTGAVTTIAGNGIRGVKNGPVMSAGFGNASAIAVNSFGDIYILDIGSDVPNEGSCVLRRIENGNTVTSVDIADANGNKIYLTRSNGIMFNKENLLYLAASDNYIHTLRFDGYKLQSALPAGLVFDEITGVISGTPTMVSAQKAYPILVMNAGGTQLTSAVIEVRDDGTALKPSIITFPTPDYGGTWDENYNLNPNITSTNKEVPLEIVSSNTDIITINPDGTLHVVGTGNVTITVYQEGNANYSPATPVWQSYIIGPDDQVLTFPAINEKTVCDLDFPANVTSTSSKNAIVYTSTTPTVATISSAGMIHIIGPGTTTIMATQPGSKLYNAAQPVSRVLTVTAAKSPSVTVLESPAERVCAGSEVTFVATAQNAVEPSYQWKINGIAAGIDDKVFKTSALKDGDVVTCTITSQPIGNCLTDLEATSAPYMAKVSKPLAVNPTLSIVASATSAYQGTLISFIASAQSSVTGTYQWLVNGVAAGTSSIAFSSADLHNGDVVSCIFTPDNACATPVTSNQISINVLPQPVITIPNTFTPNDDGKNDTWLIPSLSAYPQCLVQVFSRYGQMVMTSRGYNKPWNGTNAGKQLPAGVYYYIIDMNDGKPKLSGNVTIIR